MRIRRGSKGTHKSLPTPQRCRYDEIQDFLREKADVLSGHGEPSYSSVEGLTVAQVCQINGGPDELGELAKYAIVEASSFRFRGVQFLLQRPVDCYLSCNVLIPGIIAKFLVHSTGKQCGA